MRALKNSRGAASIIVIFMILVLFVFGMLSMTTAIANKRLSDKSALWIKDFYQLEYKAESLLYNVDALLEQAEVQALEKVYRDYTQGGLPRTDIDVDYHDQLQRYFYYYACEKLATLPRELLENAELHNERYLDPGSDMNTIELPFLNLDVTDEITNKHILVSVQAVYATYDIGQAADDRVVFTRTDPLQTRYEIIEWREWQEPFDYNQPLEFWNGSLPDLPAIPGMPEQPPE